MTQVVKYLEWVDLDFPGLEGPTVATYWPSRLVETKIPNLSQRNQWIRNRPPCNYESPLTHEGFKILPGMRMSLPWRPPRLPVPPSNSSGLPAPAAFRARAAILEYQLHFENISFRWYYSSINHHVALKIRKCTRPENNACTWLQECSRRQVKAKVISCSSNKLHQTTYKYHFRA